MTFLKSFLSLPARTRILIGSGFLAWGMIGLWVTDRAESRLGLQATEEDVRALKNGILPRIEVVERGGGGGAGNGEI